MSEFKVSTYISGNQEKSEITTLEDGGFVVVWTSGIVVPWASSGQDGDGYGVYAQRYDANGAIQGVEFQVNTYTTGNQLEPSTTALKNGGFVVTWTAEGQDSDSTAVYGQIYDREGVRQGVEFQVNTYEILEQSNPATTELHDGGFVVSWASFGQDTDGDGIFAQRFDLNGAKQGAEFQVNTEFQGWQSATSLATSADEGSFIITWQSEQVDDAGLFGEINGQSYNAIGEKQGVEFQINTNTLNSQYSSKITALNDGGFVVTWTSYHQGGNIQAQLLNNIGEKVGQEFQVTTQQNLSNSSVTNLSDGGFVVTWTTNLLDLSDDIDIHYQIFDKNGVKVGIESKANTYSADDQNYSSSTGLKDGGFIITWTSQHQDDATSNGVFAQRFDSDGNKINQVQAVVEPPPITIPYQIIYPPVLTVEIPDVEITTGSHFQERMDNFFKDTDIQTYEATMVDGSQLPSWLSIDSETGMLKGTSPEVAVLDIKITATDSAQHIASDIFKISTVASTEFQVNTYLPSTQSFTTSTTLEDGGFVVVWRSSSQDGSHYGGYGQIYNANGSKRGEEFLVNTETSANQEQQYVESLKGGDFIVAWRSYNQAPDSSDGGVFAQRFDSMGGKVGEEFLVNTETQGQQYNPTIASLTAGGYVITWASELDPTTETFEIKAQVYDTENNPIQSEFQVNTYTTYDQNAPQIIGIDNNEFVVSWHSYGQDGGSWGVYGQKFSQDGEGSSIKVGNEFLINTTTTDRQVYSHMDSNADGSAYVVTWQSAGQDGSSYGVYAQRYNTEGSIGSEFQVNTTTTNSQFYPKVAFLENDDFVITWGSVTWSEFDSGKGRNNDIFAQRYNSEGIKVGGEVLVNTFTASNREDKNISENPDLVSWDLGQYGTDITSLDDGGYVISWHSYLQAGESSSWDIYAQRFDSDGNKINQVQAVVEPPPAPGHIIELFEDNYSTGANSIIEISPLGNDTDSDFDHTLILSEIKIVSGSGNISRPDPTSPNFYYIPDQDVEEEVVINYSVTDGINTQTGGVINLTVGQPLANPELFQNKSTTTEFDFSSSKDLEYVFNEEIEFGSEVSIKILKEESGTFVEKYNYTAGSEYLRIENYTTDPYNPEGSLIINPENDLEYGGKYKVIISDTSIKNKKIADAYYGGLFADDNNLIEVEATTNIANIVSKSHRFIDIFIGEKTLKDTGHLKHGIHEDIGFKAYAENGVVEVTGYNSIKYTPNEGFVGTDYIIYKTKHDGSKNDREKMHKIEIKVMGWEELKSYENDKKDGDDLSNAIISRKGLSKIDSGDGDDEIQLLADTFWEGSYFAINTETGQKFSLSGKNRFLDEIDGGQGADKILLTEESDAFFFEDSFSGHHSSSLLKSTERGVDSKERIEGIEEVLAGAGDDIVDLTSSNFVNNSDMLIDGGDGNDILWGGTGNNEILGGAGDDILFGGIGSDKLTGGTGSDIYQFTSKDGNDIITDMSIDDSIEFYYSAGDDISSSSLSLNSGTLTWVANTSETVNIDLSATITGNDISALVGQYTFNEIV